MIRILACVLSIIALAAAAILPEAPGSGSTDNLSVQILTPDQLKLYRASNPEAVLTPLEGVATTSSVRYTLGSRIGGDSLVAVASNSYSWSSSRDVQLSLRYPSSGTGRIVTYVDIMVQQSNNGGRAYVVSGGVGSRYVSIIVESNNTSYLQYAAGIYAL